MIKICYIIGQLSRDGAERQLYELVKGLDKTKFCPVVISLSQGGYWGSEIQKLGIKLAELKRKKNKELTRLVNLIKLFKALKPTIVHTYMFSANTYGRIAAIITRTPIIIASERNAADIGKDKNKFNILIDRFLAYFSQSIICNSDKCSENLSKKYSFNAEKVFTVHNGIDATKFLDEANSYNCRKVVPKVIGTVGRLYPQKNHKLFLDVAELILNKYNKHLKFLIVGEGPLKNELKNYAKKLGIEDKIIFTGEKGNIPTLLHKIDIFVMTSLYEGLSNVIMEAMLAGLPVLATHVGGNSELVVDGKTGFLCPSNDAQYFAERIIRLLNNGSLAKKMGENGKVRIMEEFQIEKMISKTENIYNKLLSDISL